MASGIGGFNANTINNQFKNDLAAGKNPGLQTARTASGADSSKATEGTKTPRSKPAKEGVVLSAAAQAEAKKAQAETGEAQEQARQAGHDIDGDYQTPDEQNRSNDLARERAGEDVPPGGMRLETKDGQAFVLDAKQTAVIEKHYDTDPKALDEQYEKLMKEWSPEQRAAIEATVESQIAQKGGSVKQAFAHLKPLPPDVTSETAKPILDPVETTGPMEIRGADAPSKNASVTITPELPPETEAAAKEFAQKKALEGGSDEAFVAGGAAVAGAAGIGAAAATEKATASAAAEKVDTAVPMTEAKAKELLELSQKTLVQANQTLVANVAAEGVALQLSQAKDQMVAQGATPAQARQQIGQALKQNGGQLQQTATQESQRILGQLINERAGKAKEEANSKGFKLDDRDAILVAQMNVHNENLSKTAQKNLLHEMMGPDSGVPSARDIMQRNMGEDGQLNHGAFAQDMKAVLEQHQPAITKKINDIYAQAAKTTDPAEKEKLFTQAETMEAHVMGYHDAFVSGTIVDAAKQSLVAKEFLDTKGASSEPKSLALLDTGKIVLDAGPAAGGANPTAADLNARSRQDWAMLDTNMEKAGIKEEHLDDLKKNIKDKAAAMAADDPNGKNDPAEFTYICQAAELATYATRQLATVDPNSEQGKAFLNSAQSGFSYIESREAYLNAQLPDSVKNNPAFQTYKSEWMKAKATLTPRG